MPTKDLVTFGLTKRLAWQAFEEVLGQLNLGKKETGPLR